MDINQDLSCPVCLELYTHPVILPCGHVLCRTPCAKTIFDLSPVRCPLCRESFPKQKELSTMPRVMALESIIDKLKTFQRLTHKPFPGAEICASHPDVGQSKSPTTDAWHEPEALAYRKSIASIPDLINLISNLRQTRESMLTSYPMHGNLREGPIPKGMESNYVNTYLSSFQSFSQHRMPVDTLNKHSVLIDKPAGFKLLNPLVPPPLPARSLTKLDLLLPVETLKALTSMNSADYELQGCGDQSWRSSLQDTRCSYFKYVLTNSCDSKQFSKKNIATLVDDLCLSSKSVEDTPFQHLVTSHHIKNSQNDVIKIRCDSSKNHTGDVCNTPDQISAVSRKPAREENNSSISNLSAKLLPENLSNTFAASSKPEIDLVMCCRNSHTVVLALFSPSDCDVIDHYKTSFGTMDQWLLGMEETYISGVCPNVHEGHRFVLIENLCHSTEYFFSVTSVNLTGDSAPSDTLRCSTLDAQSSSHIVICQSAGPVMVDTLSRASMTSARVVCSQGAHQKIARRLLLYRRDDPSRCTGVWYRAPDLSTQEGGLNEVVRLSPDTGYQFIVLDCISDGLRETKEMVDRRYESQTTRRGPYVPPGRTSSH